MLFDPVDVGHAELHHESNHHDQKYKVGHGGTHTEATGVAGLGQQVTQGGPQRTSDDKGGPECQHGIETNQVMRGGNRSDNGRKDEQRRDVAQCEFLPIPSASMGRSLFRCERIGGTSPDRESVGELPLCLAEAIMHQSGSGERCSGGYRHRRNNVA